MVHTHVVRAGLPCVPTAAYKKIGHLNSANGEGTCRTLRCHDQNEKQRTLHQPPTRVQPCRSKKQARLHGYAIEDKLSLRERTQRLTGSSVSPSLGEGVSGDRGGAAIGASVGRGADAEP